mmetsp:Transcript_24111/g.21424  ORF Transcript_24111/g.21424 Transcript_24111/m.21424 type:complete len:80 (+) Transcript_24111:375-614(+)
MKKRNLSRLSKKLGRKVVKNLPKLIMNSGRQRFRNLDKKDFQKQNYSLIIANKLKEKHNLFGSSDSEKIQMVTTNRDMH